MKSPYGNPWKGNAYANPKVEAAKARAKRRAQSLMLNVAIWSSVPATIVTIAVAVAVVLK